MARISDTFNFGDNSDIDLEELLVVIGRMYTDLATAINSKPDVYQRDVDGDPGDVFLAQGSININLNTNKVQMLTNHVNPTTVTWTTLS